MKFILYGLIALIAIIATVFVVVTNYDTAQKAEKRADRVFGKLDDVYGTNKSIVQKVKVDVSGQQDSGVQYDVIDNKISTDDGNDTQKQSKVIKKRNGQVIVNVIANNQDTQEKAKKDKFDEDWDSFEADFNSKKAEW